MSDSGDEAGVESRPRMLRRHRAELLAAQKAAARLGKKRAEEGAALVAEANTRHAAELAALQQSTAAAAAAAAGPAPAAPAAEAGEGAPDVAAQLAATSMADGAAAAAPAQQQQQQPAAFRPSKAAKRRVAKAAEESERAARVEAERAAAGPSARALEAAALDDQLRPLGLAVREMKADGHCLYRSLEDQLAAAAGSPAPGRSHAQLRALAASHMRVHPDQFSPFVESSGEEGDGFEAYCREVESTAAWGGELELRALAAALGRPIAVHAAGRAPLRVGGDEGGDVVGEGGELRVAFLQHAFGLGEHYNSVVPLDGP